MPETLKKKKKKKLGKEGVHCIDRLTPGCGATTLCFTWAILGPQFCDLPSIPTPSPAEDEPLLPEIPKCDANVLDTTVVTPASWLSDTFRNVLTHRAFVSQFHNFLLGLQLHTDYLQNSQFSMWKGNLTCCQQGLPSLWRKKSGCGGCHRVKDEKLLYSRSALGRGQALPTAKSTLAKPQTEGGAVVYVINCTNSTQHLYDNPRR